jgi:hypothetical protein
VCQLSKPTDIVEFLGGHRCQAEIIARDSGVWTVIFPSGKLWMVKDVPTRIVCANLVWTLTSASETPDRHPCPSRRRWLDKDVHTRILCENLVWTLTSASETLDRHPCPSRKIRMDKDVHTRILCNNLVWTLASASETPDRHYCPSRKIWMDIDVHTARNRYSVARYVCTFGTTVR